MDLSRTFDLYTSKFDDDFAKSVMKWKKLFLGCVLSVAKISKKDNIEVFQDLMLELVEEKVKFDTPQYTYNGHSYVITDKRMGSYVWIETPPWNKVYIDGRWIMVECLEPIEKSSLDSYIYRQICQFKVDYLGKALTKKNGYTLEVGEKKSVKIRSGNSGTFSKEISRKICKNNVTLSSMSAVLGENLCVGDIVQDTKVDALSSACLGSLFDVMRENMSSEALEHAIQTRILGESLTIPTRKVKLFNREMDLVQRIYEGDDPLEQVCDNVAPVKIGMNQIKG